MSALGKLTRRYGDRPWFARLARLMVPADRLVGRLTRGRVVALGLIPSLIITTVGRNSGLPRSNPLLYVRDGNAFVVIGSNWGLRQHPAWALNLLAQPLAEASVKGTTVRVRARLTEGAERDRLWRLLVAEWPAYPAYVERTGGRAIHIFRLEPTPPPGATGPVRRS